jgi:uncharacterized protein (DUF885 family)
MKKLDGIKEQAVAPERINYQVYKAQIAAFIAAQQFREFEKPLNADSAFWSNMAGTARRPMTTENSSATT